VGYPDRGKGQEDLPEGATFLLGRRTSEGGRNVGFVAWGASRDADAAKNTGEIYAIYVLPEC
jgi:ribosomal protein S18 acetylase RimI-like enzyme